MKRIIYILSLSVAAANLASCESYFEPAMPSADYSAEEILGGVSRAQALLNPAYAGLPGVADVDFDYYSDNAVHKEMHDDNLGVNYDKMYSGWTSENSPNSGKWNSSLAMINTINAYIRDGRDVVYSVSDPESGEKIKERMLGEAYGLRAYYQWILLKNFAGPDGGGQFLSYPILDKPFDELNVNEIPRASYKDGFDRIMADIEEALKHIEYKRYDGDKNWNNSTNVGRVSREMLYALKARVYLFAASPAFKQVTSAEAAKVAYDAIVYVDGEEKLWNLTGYNRRYNDTKDEDHLWRSKFGSNGSLESSHFPISMWGNGICNPTEDFVRSIPDSEGFPIDESSIYDPAAPYENRDMRFENYVFYNGENKLRESSYGMIDMVETFVGGADADGGARLLGTRTGYYMKRLLSNYIDRTPRNSHAWSDIKFNVIFSRRMLYLDFAEAAIDAWGTTGKDGAMVFSAVDAIEKVRSRVGLDETTDKYLRPVAATDLAKLKNLVRNERRLATAFEGERLYDMMRWLLPAEQMTKADGITITKESDGSFTYEYKPVVAEKRFDERMYYFPIPRTEILKSNALVQNQGWE